MSISCINIYMWVYIKLHNRWRALSEDYMLLLDIITVTYIKNAFKFGKIKKTLIDLAE